MIPATITCVECGGRCVLMTPYEAGAAPEPGDIVVYRCPVCFHRYDIELTDDDTEDQPLPA